MNDFISRESAVKAITEYKVTIESENMPEITKCCFQMLNITCDKNIGFINSIPAADVQPVKRGKDVCDSITDRHCEFKCSLCGEEMLEVWCDNEFNYCPFCGATISEE